MTQLHAALQIPPVPPVPPVPPIPQEGPIIVHAGGGAPLPPEAVVIIVIAVCLTIAALAIGVPLARAWARRQDRKMTAGGAGTAEVLSRLDRIEHAIDAMSIEVERISEGQRFTTKVLSERAAEPAPARRALPDR